MRNYEIKARCRDFEKARRILSSIGAEKKEVVFQEDVFLALGPERREKLRFSPGRPAQRVVYSRKDATGIRPSDYTVDELTGEECLELMGERGIKGKVTKERELWTWKNVRIHLDTVEGLGTFVELESVLVRGITETEARKRAEFLARELGITASQVIPRAYIDLSME